MVDALRHLPPGAGALLVLVGGLVLWLVLRGAVSAFVQHGLIGSPSRPTRRAGLRIIAPERRVQRAQAIGTVLANAVSVVVVLVVLMLLAQVGGISLQPVLAGVSVAGVAVAFGTQQVIKDFLAGLLIIVEDQYGIGDVIEIGDVNGVVESVGLRITRVRDERGVVWYLRNGELTKVGNRSQGDYRPADPVGPESSAKDE